MAAEDDFLAEPVGFMRKCVLRPIIHGYSVTTKRFKFTRDVGMEVKKGSFHWYSKSLKYYKVEEDPNGAIEAYVLGYKDNDAPTAILGTQANDPRIMFTYRMDGCSLGYAQAGPHSPAYVSHHNDKTGGNNPLTMANQQVDFSDGATPALAFAHKVAYMTDSKAQFNTYYKSTTVGVRDNGGIWRFYLQVRKFHGLTDNDLSLKGVIPINP